MAIHRIMLPVGLRDATRRAVVWDDEAGTVEGDHRAVPLMQRVLDDPERPVEFGTAGFVWDLHDPGHRPDEFLVLLYVAHWPILEEPLRSTLPPVFDGVSTPPGEKAEVLTDEHGNPL